MQQVGISYTCTINPPQMKQRKKWELVASMNHYLRADQYVYRNVPFWAWEIFGAYVPGGENLRQTVVL